MVWAGIVAVTVHVTVSPMVAWFALLLASTRDVVWVLTRVWAGTNTTDVSVAAGVFGVGVAVGSMFAVGT